jgi:hypothetical protein
MESHQCQSPQLTDRSPELLERCQRLQARAWERSQHVTPNPCLSITGMAGDATLSAQRNPALGAF